MLAFTHMLLYMRSPLGPICWFCSLVLTKSSGKTHVTPMIPAIPPLMIFGSRLQIEGIKSWAIDAISLCLAN